MLTEATDVKNAAFDACSQVSANRTTVMGVAILLIMLFHVEIIQSSFCAYWGVDVFVFVSGFGIYHSLNKLGGSEYRLFYKKRLLRIMPAACISGVAVAALNYFFDNIAFHDFCLPYGIDYLVWSCGVHLWYIRCILILYLLSPFLFSLIEHISRKKICFFVGSVFAFFAIFLFFTRFVDLKWRLMYVMTASWTTLRLPIFLMGMLTARYGRLYHNIGNWNLILSLALLFAAIGIKFGGLDSLPLISKFSDLLAAFLLIPSIIVFCLTFGVLLKRMPKPVENILMWLGKYSLEIYVIHEALFAVMSSILGEEHKTCTIMIVLAVSLVLAYLLKIASQYITHWISETNA